MTTKMTDAPATKPTGPDRTILQFKGCAILASTIESISDKGDDRTVIVTRNNIRHMVDLPGDEAIKLWVDASQAGASARCSSAKHLTMDEVISIVTEAVSKLRPSSNPTSNTGKRE